MIELLNPSAPAFKSASINQVLARIMGDNKKTTATVQTLFHEQGWFHRCVDLRAKAIQNLPWHITRTGSEEPIWDCDAPDIPDELAFASDLPRLLYLWEACLVTAQRAYTLKESEGNGTDGLFYFNPLKVEPVKTPVGIFQYKRMVNGTYEYYDAEDVIALFAPDPFVEGGPGGKLAGKKNAEVLRALEGFLHSFLDKGAIKATLLTVDGVVQEEDRSRLKDAWNRLLSGWKNAGKAEIFNSKVTPHTIGDGLKDLSNGQLTKDEREAICAALGIPMSLMMSSAANFATAEMDHVNFIKYTVQPSSKFLMRQINKQLFTPAGFRFIFEPEKLEVLQRYELDKAEKVVAVTGGPVLTIEEGRKLLGYGPMPDAQEAPQEQQEQPRQIKQGEEIDAATEDVKALVGVVRELIEARPTYTPTEARPTYTPDAAAKAAWERSMVEGLIDPLKQASGLSRSRPVSTEIIDDAFPLPLDLSDSQLKESVRETDLKAWQRKIKKKGRDVKFTPDALNDYEAAVIRERLESDMPLAEVFEGPFVNFY